MTQWNCLPCFQVNPRDGDNPQLSQFLVNGHKAVKKTLLDPLEK